MLFPTVSVKMIVVCVVVYFLPVFLKIFGESICSMKLCGREDK